MFFKWFKKYRDCQQEQKFRILFMFLIIVKYRTEHTFQVWFVLFETKEKFFYLIWTPMYITMSSDISGNITKTGSYQIYKH